MAYNLGLLKEKIKGILLHLSRQTVNVNEFGATGNGTNDDTANIQAAINYAVNNHIPEVVLNPGTYLISNQIQVTSNDLIIKGNKGTTIKATNTFPGGEISMLFLQNCNRITIDGLEFDGSLDVLGSSERRYAIYTFQCNDIIIQNNHIFNYCNIAVRCYYGERLLIQDNKIEQGAYHGIHTRSIDDVVIYRNHIIGAGQGGTQIGILAIYGNRVWIESNRIFNTADTATKTEGSCDVMYCNNYVEHFGKDGIKVMFYTTDGVTTSPKNVKIIGNTVKYLHPWRPDGSHYIGGHTMENVVIADNIIEGGGYKQVDNEDGIRVNANSKNVNIHNNIVNHVRNFDIHVINSQDVIITYNDLSGKINQHSNSGTVIAEPNITGG